ncbi:MAG: DUF998 domain-containing protein [Promethearchaeota archaeon]|jgi:hypothetical membrane protein
MKQNLKLFRGTIASHIVVIGALIGFLTAITAILLYMMGDPTFSFITHWVSHLGTGPNGSAITFNGGMIYSGIISWIYSAYLAIYLFKKGAMKILIATFPGCGIILGIGLLMIGMFPLEVNFGIHNIAAGFFFYGGMSSCITYGITVYLTPSISKLHSIIGFLIASIFLSYIIINSLPLDLSYKAIAEWVVFFSIPTWILSQGILILRSNYTKT